MYVCMYVFRTVLYAYRYVFICIFIQIYTYYTYICTLAEVHVHDSNIRLPLSFTFMKSTSFVIITCGIKETENTYMQTYVHACKITIITVKILWTIVFYVIDCEEYIIIYKTTVDDKTTAKRRYHPRCVHAYIRTHTYTYFMNFNIYLTYVHIHISPSCM